MGHFGVKKTLDILHEHLFRPRMRCDVDKMCDIGASHVKGQNLEPYHMVFIHI